MEPTLFEQNQSTRLISFDEIKQAANKIIGGVWLTNRNKEFAKLCWKIFEDSNLTCYSNEVERMKVYMRLISIGRIYREFHGILEDEYIEPEYEEWTGLLNITNFRLGQIVGMNENFLEEEDEFQNYLNAMNYLSNQFRPEVYEALVKGLKGKEYLFLELYNTSLKEGNELNDIDDENEVSENSNQVPTISEVLGDNDISNSKFEAYTWVIDGCYPYY